MQRTLSIAGGSFHLDFSKYSSSYVLLMDFGIIIFIVYINMFDKETVSVINETLYNLKFPWRFKTLPVKILNEKVCMNAVYVRYLYIMYSNIIM